MRNKSQTGFGQNAIIFIFVLVITGVSFFFLGKDFEKKSSVKDLSTLKNLVQVSSPQADNQKDIPLLVDVNSPQKGLVLSTNISQVLRGTLTSFTKNSWTIKYSQHTFTVTQQVPSQKMSFFLTNRKTNKTAPVKQNELKVGDYVNIITQYLPKEGKMAITSITAYRE